MLALSTLSNPKQNNAGGYSCKVSKLNQLRRFLTLGCEHGTYYIGKVELTVQNTQNIITMLTVENDEMGEKVVKEVVDFSVNNRAPKVDYGLFVMALCLFYGQSTTRRLALEKLTEVCRIPTHLFTLLEFYQTIRETVRKAGKEVGKKEGKKAGENAGKEVVDAVGKGWGRAMRTGISKWYTDKDSVERLAFIVTKYKQRNGWTHHDVLRLCHANPKKSKNEVGLQLLFCYITKGWDEFNEKYESMNEQQQPQPQPQQQQQEPQQQDIVKMVNFLKILHDLKVYENPDNNQIMMLDSVVEKIKEFRLCREHLPTKLLSHSIIWKTLLQTMPMTAMLRNLANMTKQGVLTPLSPETDLVVKRLNDSEKLHKSKIHPIAILIALTTYKKGSSIQDHGHSSSKWCPVPVIVSALDSSYYLAFQNIQPTNRRFLLALDVSGSMTASCSGTSVLSCRTASAALAMVTARTEKKHHFVGFSHKLVNMSINSSMSLSEVEKVISAIPMGGTNCSEPMLYALKQKIEVDVFIVFTDSETQYRNITPSDALKLYRKEMNLPETKMIVFGMTSNNFTIADPDDPFMLDIAGFDASAPDDYLYSFEIPRVPRGENENQVAVALSK
eukprot:Pgem_evm1s9891